MSRTQTLTFALAGLLLCSGVALAAGEPSNVSSVTASYINDKLTVQWAPATDATGIAFYRVYVSRKSILDNQGDWEDFNRTPGSETMYTFEQNPYPGKTTYVSVLAVNTAGIESQGFEAEASVDAPAIPPPAQTPPPAVQEPILPPPAQPVQEEFKLVNVQPTSSTGIVLFFSRPVANDPALTPGHFIIVDASGAVLNITEVSVENTAVSLETSAQVPEKVYVVGLLQDLRSQDGGTLSSATSQVPFNGFDDGSVKPWTLDPIPSSVSSSASSSSAPAIFPPVGTVYGPPPGMQPTKPVYKPPVYTQPTQQVYIPSDKLSNSGVGLLAVTAVSGALAGHRIRRKRRSH